MPVAPRRPCAWQGCSRLTDARYCDEHRRAKTVRSSAAARGYDSRWREYSRGYLEPHRWCADPYGYHRRSGEQVRATCTDHVVPHRGDPRLFWDAANHQPLCDSCHSSKTAAEDGGFGNPRADWRDAEQG